MQPLEECGEVSTPRFSSFHVPNAPVIEEFSAVCREIGTDVSGLCDYSTESLMWLLGNIIFLPTCCMSKNFSQTKNKSGNIEETVSDPMNVKDIWRAVEQLPIRMSDGSHPFL